MFGRSKRKSSQAEESATPTTETSSSAPDPETATETPERTTGPFDESEVDGLDGRIDLGGIWLRPVQGMEVRLEVDQASEMVSAVQVSLDDATAQLGRQPLGARAGAIPDGDVGGAGVALFGMVAVFAQLRVDTIRENTMRGLAHAKAQGRVGGRPSKMTPEKITSMARPITRGA